MSTSTILMLGLTVGLPCTLLALAIVYHARAGAAARMPAADEGWDEAADYAASYDQQYAEQYASEYETESAEPAFRVAMPDDLAPGAPLAASAFEEQPDPALAEMRQIIAELQQQLAGQRTAVAGLLSERERAAEQATPATPRVMTVVAEPEQLAATDLRGAVQRLTAEGLSERSIARRLHIGLEEVRLVSRRERVS